MHQMSQGELASCDCPTLLEAHPPCEHPESTISNYYGCFLAHQIRFVFSSLLFMSVAAHLQLNFGTEHSQVALYMTAIASLSSLVQKPIIKISPENGLEVTLSGSGATGSPPTTLSPSILMVDWRCEKALGTPYEVQITIPVENYEAVQFTLTKMCEYRQDKGGDTMRGWAIFGVFSCILVVFSTLFCCGGFIYKTRVGNQHGLDAFPGLTVLSACLETMSGGGQGYSRPEDVNSTFVNQATWQRPPVSAQETRRTSERKYGAI